MMSLRARTLRARGAGSTLTLVPFAVSFIAACAPAEPLPTPDLLLTSAHLVDVEAGEVRGPVDIAVREGLILSINAPGEGPAPDSTTRMVDATGTFAIPGLHDMHTHLWNRDLLAEVYLTHGVTSVRDMGGARDGWGDWIREADSLPVPRALNGAAIVDGIQSGSFFFVEARDSAAATQRVDEMAAEGADFIKVYSRLGVGGFAGAVARAGQLDLDVVGHVPYAVPASQAVEAGMRSIEHFTGIALECSQAGETLRARILALLAPLQRDSVDPEALQEPLSEAYRLERFEALDRYDPSECTELMTRIGAGDVWITPTLVVSGDGAESKRARVQPVLDGWPEWMQGMMLPRDEPEYATPDRIQTLREMFGDLDARGARWLAGSDAPNPGSAPGIGLHHELELLVEFGLSPLDALRAATLHAAEFERRLDSSGSLEAGKDADVVLLHANPLEDITNTRAIRSVILRGNVVR